MFPPAGACSPGRRGAPIFDDLPRLVSPTRAHRRISRARFVTTVDAFTGGGSALYTEDSTGNLNLERATLRGAPQNISVNDEVTVKLRQGARRLELSRVAERPARDWAFPMAVHGRLCGALVVAREPRASYRSEELSQLADSAQTIGLNLENLRAANLQQNTTSVRSNSTSWRQQTNPLQPRTQA